MSLTLQACNIQTNRQKRTNAEERVQKNDKCCCVHNVLVSLHFLSTSKTRALFKRTDEAEA